MVIQQEFYFTQEPFNISDFPVTTVWIYDWMNLVNKYNGS